MKAGSTNTLRVVRPFPEPASGEELREVALIAHAMLALESCKMYGLIEGGPEVNVERCEEIIARAQAEGIRFSEKRITDAAIAMIHEINDGRPGPQ